MLVFFNIFVSFEFVVFYTLLYFIVVRIQVSYWFSFLFRESKIIKFPNNMVKAYPISSTGIVMNLIPRFSVLSYHTTGISVMSPVNSPFTIKNGMIKNEI